MLDPHGDRDEAPEQQLIEDLCRLLREGLVVVDADDVVDIPRFSITVRGRAELSDVIETDRIRP